MSHCTLGIIKAQGCQLESKINQLNNFIGQGKHSFNGLTSLFS